MNPEDFEKQLKRQAVRQLPADWRADILTAAKAAAQTPGAPSPAPSSFLSTINHHLSTLLWPCPKAWAGLAAVWVAILAFNHFTMDRSQVMTADAPPPSPQMMMAVQEQRKMLARLMEPSEESPAEPPKPFVPQPRGELREFVGMA